MDPSSVCHDLIPNSTYFTFSVFHHTTLSQIVIRSQTTTANCHTSNVITEQIHFKISFVSPWHFSSFFFLVPCSRFSWLSVSFLVHIKHSSLMYRTKAGQSTLVNVIKNVYQHKVPVNIDVFKWFGLSCNSMIQLKHTTYLHNYFAEISIFYTKLW